MGARGPAPKPEGQRRRTNKVSESGESMEVTTIVVDEAFKDQRVPAPDADESWHEIAKMVWDSALESAQRTFYEPSDWAYLYLLCNEISLELSEKVIGIDERGEPVRDYQPMNGSKLAGIQKGLTDLLFTQSARLRARIEIKRNASAPATPAGVTSISKVRQRRLGGQG